MEKKQFVPIYIEIVPNERWEVHADTSDGTLFGFIQHVTYSFPMNLFLPKGEYWFFPRFRHSSLDMVIGKTKEKAFEKFLDLYCDAEVKGA